MITQNTVEKKLRIAIIQADIFWENPESNLKKYDLLIPEKRKFDLIVMPEMFSTGFSVSTRDGAEESNGISFQWLQQKAKSLNTAMIGSIPTIIDGKLFNRLYFIFPDGTFEYYDKHHLFSYSGEHLTFSAGEKRVIVNYKGWKILPLVCYDLRFPVWNCNRFEDGSYDYDMAIYIANWPHVRTHAWKVLLQARAIENQCWVVASNRVGIDGKEIYYSGNSAVINPYGEEITSVIDEETVLEAEADLDFLNSYRNKFSVASDWDKFQIL